jgi:curved DNA-binding protein CbpA
MSNYYSVLGVDQNASEKEITKTFRAKARKLHPDKQPPTASDAEKKRACDAFKELVSAYEVLSDETKRKRYDLQFSDKKASQSSQPASQKSQGKHASQKGSTSFEAETAERKRREQWQQHYQQDDSDGETERERERRKTREQEEQMEERRRRTQEERDKAFEGLGSHWVKPPSFIPKAPVQMPFEAKNRNSPMPKTKAQKKTGRKKRATRDKTDEDSDCPSDRSSDSSILSFDIYIDLKKYDFNITMDDVEEPEKNTEVWTIKQNNEGKKVLDGKIGGEQMAEPDGKDDEAKGKNAKPKAKTCCALQ